MKQTAVEWLIEQISSLRYFYSLMEEIQSRSTIAEPNGILHQAKAMEKEQIMKAVYDSMGTNVDPNMGRAELYYNENYGK
jgi:hypothetical protein